MEQQGHRRERLDGAGQVDRRRRAPLVALGAVHRIDRMRVVEAVGEPGRVREQVPHADRLERRHGLRLQVRTAVEHVHVGELGQEARDRVGEFESATLVEHHRRDGRDRLGHRVDAKDRVRFDGQAAFDVTQTTMPDMGDRAAARDEHRPARQSAAVHVALQQTIDAVQAGGVEPQLRRLGLDREWGAHGPRMASRRDHGMSINVVTRTSDGRRGEEPKPKRTGGPTGVREPSGVPSQAASTRVSACSSTAQ